MKGKIFISLNLILILIITSMGLFACKQEKYSYGLEYQLINNDTEYEVIGIGECVDKDIIIPSTYYGRPVTSIGKYAFKECDFIEKVTLPNSITNIGVWAFYKCSNLKSINLGNNIETFGYSPFSDCNSLLYTAKSGLRYLGDNENPYLYLIGIESDSILNADIDANCKFIGDDVFCNCFNLTSIEMPDSVVSIGEFAFSNCANLNSIKLSNNLVNLEDYAFVYCSSLTKIFIPKSVRSIGSIVFEYCDQLIIYCEADGKTGDWAEDWNSNRPVIFGYKGD